MFIENILKKFSKTEKREFILFLDRKKRKDNRKDIQVMEELMNNFKPKVENANNYHAIRNRIKKELILFIYLKQIETDTTKESEIINEVNLCRYLFNKQLVKEAWEHLLKAEKKAENLKSYKNSYSIYILMLEFSYTDESINIDEIILKKNEAKKQLDQEEKLIDSLASARRKIQLFKTNAEKQSLVHLIKEIKNNIDTNHPDFYLHPKQVCNYLELIRGSFLYNRDIRTLEPIAIDLYNKTAQQKSFSSSTVAYELRILYIIAHVLYRNQKLNESLTYCIKIEKIVTETTGTSYDYYFAKTAALKSSICFLTGKIKEAISIIEEFYTKNLSPILEDDLNLKLTLLTYYAYHKEYKKANQFFSQLNRSDGWYKKRMGQEWVFKKNSIEMLLHFEMGKDDIALNRINSIISLNYELTELKQYKDIIYFLKLFKKYIKDPTSVVASDLLALSSKSNVISADNEIKKTAFYTWFLAKVKNKDPYEFLLNTVQEIEVEVSIIV